MRKLALTAAIVALCDAPAAAADIAGRATVVDGDTIGVEGTVARIRLDGIDAPEGKQTCADAAGKTYLCGPKAAEALAALIGRNGRATCVPKGVDRYKRQIATCTANGVEINREMVRLGWAVDYVKYSGGLYEAEETEARSAKRGMWAGTFEMPWDWRAAQRGVALPQPLLTQRLAQAETTAKSCKDARTCRDAVILWCGGYSRADNDSDGIPCENVCRTLKQVEPIKKEIGCEM